jgi:HPt (histidine-containing phosphotransfer) domain-containing protein
MQLNAEGMPAALLGRDGDENSPVMQRPVDLVHLARYTLGNRALEREVLELFRTQSRLYLTRLKGAGNEKAWRDAAHTIKGSARGIGAWRVAKRAESAEGLKGKTFKSSRENAVHSLEAEINETNGFIQALLIDA